MISKFYRCRIDFEPEQGTDMEALFDEMSFILTTYDTYENEYFYGNPACGPYVMWECVDKVNAERSENIIKDLVKEG